MQKRLMVQFILKPQKPKNHPTHFARGTTQHPPVPINSFEKMIRLRQENETTFEDETEKKGEKEKKRRSP